MTTPSTDTDRVTTVAEQHKKWDTCDERYVQNIHFWRWIVGAISGSILLVGTTVFTLTRWGAAMEKEDAMLNMRVNQVELTQEKIVAVRRDLDTLKTLIRERR